MAGSLLPQPADGISIDIEIYAGGIQGTNDNQQIWKYLATHWEQATYHSIETMMHLLNTKVPINQSNIDSS